MSDHEETNEEGFNTRAARTWSDGERRSRPMSVPIVQASTFEASSSEALADEYRSRGPGLYTRFGNPTTDEAGAKIADLERAEAGLVFASGMAAITTSLLAVLRPGAHVVAQRDIFAQTYTFFDRIAPNFGVEVSFVDATDLAEIRAAAREDTELFYIETPSNPLIKIVDVEGAVSIAREHDALLFVDATFASPAIQSTIGLGADLAIHSATKYLAGHSDLMAGAVAGSRSLVEKIKEMQIQLGGVMDPHAAWLLLRGIKTLGVRVERQSATALAMARHLESRPEISRVNYAGLKSSPYYELARRQMRAGGGVFSFEVDGGLEAARAFIEAFRTIPIATSLGGVETLTEIPAELDFGEEEFGDDHAETGITPSLIRISVGLEDEVDLIADLDRGLRAIAR